MMNALLNKVVELEKEAAEFGFCWETTAQIMDQIHSECQEIDEHLHQGIHDANTQALEEEIGDLLHAVFSLCVFCQFNPKNTLEQTLNKFERRLNKVKLITKERGLTNLKDRNFDELMEVWKMAKNRTD